MNRLPDTALDPRVRALFSSSVRSFGEQTSGMDPAWAVDFFLRFYHRPLSKLVDLGGATALECASGFGHAALAYVVAGGARILGVDRTEARVRAANALAERVGLADRARFEVGDIHDLPGDRVDVTVTLQTLEHVPRAVEALSSLASLTRQAVVLSTPNRLFPKDGHDSGLLFSHWLPPGARRRWVALRRPQVRVLNTFLTPMQIDSTLQGFRRATVAYNFPSLEEWLDQFPCFFPYAGRGRFLPARAERRRWQAAATAYRLLGQKAQYLAPMFEGIYVRTDFR